MWCLLCGCGQATNRFCSYFIVNTRKLVRHLIRRRIDISHAIEISFRAIFVLLSAAPPPVNSEVHEIENLNIQDIEKMFGETVARIVDGLTKISSLKKDMDVSLQAENFRKMLLTLNDDVRVIIIKIADRLHNMQTMDSMRSDKQVKIASETLYIYAPLAHRIGLYNIKTELEDLGLKYTEPDVYNDILNKIKETKEDQDNYIQEFSKIISTSLNKEQLDYQIKGRPKSIFSIRRKMLNQGVSFDEVYDKFAVRIIYKCDPESEKFIAWKIYSIVTDHFRPNPTRLRDWISSPKSTGYEALHITVVGPKGRWVEVQIRSERMNEIAEKGYAAHYKYKQGNDTDDSIDVWIAKLQETLENPEIDAIDFVEQFKLNLYSKEIFVFTPKGDLKSLPKGATPLDFAFSIHTEVGMKTRGAKVNGKLVPLSHQLKSGDRVDILTAENLRNDLLDLWVDKQTRTKGMILVTHDIEEAILMANRILIFSSDPGKIQAEIPVNLPFPRIPQAAKFRQLVDKIYTMMTISERDRLLKAKKSRTLREQTQPTYAYRLPQADVSELTGLLESMILHEKKLFCHPI